jgi:hypothetical protein
MLPLLRQCLSALEARRLLPALLAVPLLLCLKDGATVSVGSCPAAAALSSTSW